MALLFAGNLQSERGQIHKQTIQEVGNILILCVLTSYVILKVHTVNSLYHGLQNATHKKKNLQETATVP